jgi:large subunit ribosomal protein L17
MRNLCIALLRFETIRTTVPKAKELRRVVEPLINSGKADSEAARRRAFAKLRDAELVTKLFEDLGPRFKERQGGYTRILRLEDRPGDSAPMALMQLTEAPKAAEVAAEAPAKKTRARKAKPEGEAAEPKRKRAAA